MEDLNYRIYPCGSVFRLHGRTWKQTGLAKSEKNGKQYHHLKYCGQNLLVSRISYRKHHGVLHPYLVVNHIDGNSLNDAADNVELVTQQINIFHCQPGWAETEAG